MKHHRDLDGFYYSDILDKKYFDLNELLYDEAEFYKNNPIVKQKEDSTKNALKSMFTRLTIGIIMLIVTFVFIYNDVWIFNEEPWTTISIVACVAVIVGLKNLLVSLPSIAFGAAAESIKRSTIRHKFVRETSRFQTDLKFYNNLFGQDIYGENKNKF